MGSATEERQKSSAVMVGSFCKEDVFSICFKGPARDLMQFLKNFENHIGMPYFGWNGEFWDEN